jgi:hypothetical protein
MADLIDADVIHEGGCHCGRVRFECSAPAAIEAIECNCSICRKTGYLHLFVSKSDFRLVTGGESLITYSFGTKAAQHFFCKYCGIKSFYVPRSHPDGYSVNVRCIDEGTIRDLKLVQFDGQNWDSAIGSLKPLP